MKKRPEPIILDLHVDDDVDEENILSILQTEDFKYILKEEVYRRVVDVIEHSEKKLILFRLPAYSVDLVISERHFKKLLKSISKIYEEEEEYLKCKEINELIQKI